MAADNRKLKIAGASASSRLLSLSHQRSAESGGPGLTRQVHGRQEPREARQVLRAWTPESHCPGFILSQAKRP